MATITDNELIAEFMGYEVESTWRSVDGTIQKRYKIDDDVYYQQHMRFEDSWDWLMPVVQRIADIALESNIKDIAGTALKMVCEYPVTIERDKLHGKCIDFIKWYNANNNQKHE